MPRLLHIKYENPRLYADPQDVAARVAELKLAQLDADLSEEWLRGNLAWALDVLERCEAKLRDEIARATENGRLAQEHYDRAEKAEAERARLETTGSCVDANCSLPRMHEGKHYDHRDGVKW